MEAFNYVARLNEMSQKMRSQLFYKDLGSSGPDHNKTFTQRVVLDGAEYPEGVGKSKKEAKHDAAKKALQCLLENQQDMDDSTGARASTPTSSSWLSERGQESTIGSNDSIIDKTRRLNMSAHDNSFTETNFTGLINHYCQERNLLSVYVEEGKCGPSHNPQFFYRLVIDNKKYPVGDGKNKKEAKQRAAQLAWSALQEQSDGDSEVSSMSTSCGDTSASTPQSKSHGSSPSRDVPMSISDSVVFRDSSNHPDDQMTLGSTRGPSTSSPAGSLKPAKKRASEEFILRDPANPGRKQDNEMEHSDRKTTPQSRFTSEFDSIEHLGKGGFGRVYKARERLLNMYYAVKIVACEEKSLREVKALSDLSHQNIVRYYSCWMEESQYKQETGSVSSESASTSSSHYLYIKMELCDTKTLRNWIKKRNQRMEQVFKRREESLRIVQQVVLGVEYVHSKGFIHRDLKPDNILFGLDGAVKIGDFGLVTAENSADDGHQLKRTKAGTRSYMAPEQKNHPQYDHKVDIFALGLIFFELLWKMSTGHEKGMIWDNVRCQKFPKPFIDSFFQEAQIMKPMLSARPEERPEASSLRTELEKWTEEHLLLRNVTV